MTSLELWDDITEESSEDAAQIKRDMKYHPRTSLESMRQLVRSVDAQGGLGTYADRRYVRDRMREMEQWMFDHKDDMPKEIEDKNGNRGTVSGARLEKTGPFYETLPDDTSEIDYEHGFSALHTLTCNQSLERIAVLDREDKALVAEFGLVPAVHAYLLRRRGELFMKYRAKAGKWLRWRGMRWVVAYGNTVAILERVGRTKMDVLTLPGNLAELFELDGDVLRWKVARGRAAVGSVADGKQIRIDGKLYARSRIVQYLRTGWVSDYRKVTGTKILREDGNWDVLIKLGNKKYTIMECHNEQEADQALWAVRWAVDNFQ